MSEAILLLALVTVLVIVAKSQSARTKRLRAALPDDPESECEALSLHTTL